MSDGRGLLVALAFGGLIGELKRTNQAFDLRSGQLSQLLFYTTHRELVRGQHSGLNEGLALFEFHGLHRAPDRNASASIGFTVFEAVAHEQIRLRYYLTE